MSQLSSSHEYMSFRSNIPKRKICVDDCGLQTWTLYDAGPKTIRCPLVCLPPVSGRADTFFRQLLPLSACGYRVISLDYPAYWNVRDFCNGLRSLLDHLHLESIHLFGASLGGYLAQKFAEYSQYSARVRSLVLCNTFIDTTAFHMTGSVTTFWMMPAVVLKNIVMGDFSVGISDVSVGDSVDFISEMLDTLSQSELASRLTLNCTDGYVRPQMLQDLCVMIIDANDQNVLSDAVKEELYKCYPEARKAQLKTGGNFPYLSRPDEVNLFLQIHLRQFMDTAFSAKELQI